MRPMSDLKLRAGATAHRHVARRTRCLLVACVGLLALAACSGVAPHESDGEFRLDFDGDDVLQSEPVGAVHVSEASVSGGRAAAAGSHPGSGTALRFPDFSTGEEIPRVALVVTSGNGPLLNPHRAQFRFGADVRLESVGASSVSAQDNGDNVLQRGLSSDETQFKLQVDDGRPACAIHGPLARIQANGEELADRRWYRLTCTRTRTGVTLSVRDLLAGTEERYEADGDVGDMDFPASVPISIGCKVARTGKPLAHQADQFNGTMDAVWVGFSTD